jgi:hypothetical protein
MGGLCGGPSEHKGKMWLFRARFNPFAGAQCASLRANCSRRSNTSSIMRIIGCCDTGL